MTAPRGESDLFERGVTGVDIDHVILRVGGNGNQKSARSWRSVAGDRQVRGASGRGRRRMEVHAERRHRQRRSGHGAPLHDLKPGA